MRAGYKSRLLVFKNMVITQKNYSEQQLNIIKNLAKECAITEMTAKILYGRGYTSVDSINNFLRPQKNSFYDPYLLKNMNAVVERIIYAKENGETVIIYGDYDADGVCATAVLYKSLLEFGIEAVTVVPERENGYGLSTEIINEIIDNYFPDLLITVDCGISNFEEVEYLKDLGVDVIVTDHHEIPEVLPNSLILNCKLSNQNYPFDCLSGAGVAYKLATALIGERANKYLDLVALSTVADSMPLVDENRIIVKEGLELIKKGDSSKAIKTLVNLVGIKEITASSLAFGIAPRINAGGRMGDAYSSLKLLISDDFKEIDELSNKLIKYNVERQIECDKLYQDAKQMLTVKGNYGNLIVLAGEEWKTGLVGITAAKLAEKYNVPTILFSKGGDFYHGSARSIEGVNIYEHIKNCSELLLGFGGHAQAAGVTINIDNLDEFAKLLSEDISLKTTPCDFERKIEVDGEIKGELSKKFVLELSLFEPTGTGNKKPIFLTEVESVNVNFLKNNHLSFSDKGIDFVYFNGAEKAEVLSLNLLKSLIVEPNLSIYNGREYVKAFVKTVANVEFSLDYLYSLALENCLSNLSYGDNLNAIYIDNNELNEIVITSKKEGFGSLFIVNNPKNLSKFESLGLNKEYINLTEKTGKNCILVGGINKNTNVCGFNKIIHLDKPLNTLDLGVKTFITKEVDSFDFTSLSADRGVLVDIYKNLTKIISSGAKNLIDAYQKSEKKYSLEQFLFAGLVFVELGFIIEKDVLYLDKSTKKDLTSSNLYNKISNLNG